MARRESVILNHHLDFQHIDLILTGRLDPSVCSTFNHRFSCFFSLGILGMLLTVLDVPVELWNP